MTPEQPDLLTEAQVADIYARLRRHEFVSDDELRASVAYLRAGRATAAASNAKKGARKAASDVNPADLAKLLEGF